MWIMTILYDDGSSTPLSYELKQSATHLTEATHLAQRVSQEGFFIQRDEKLGYYIPSHRIIKITLMQKG